MSIIENNLQYNLVCSFLEWSDKISWDHEQDGSREGGRVGVRIEKDGEAVALLFFMWTSLSTGFYDQLPDCLDQIIYKPSLSHTPPQTHTQ